MASRKSEIIICRATLTVLKYSLIWPNEDEEMQPGKWYFIRITSFLIMTGIWVLSVFMHLFMAIKNNWDIHLSEDIAFLVAFCGLYYMIIIYVKNQSKVAHLLQDLSNFEKFGVPPGFEDKNKRLGFVSYCLYYYTVIGLTLMAGFNLLMKNSCEKLNEEKGLEDNCGMLTPTWFPFKVNQFPVFYLVWFYVFICIQILLKLDLIISYNALEMAHHLSLRIEHMNAMILECFDDEDYEISKEKLRVCIMYHSDILELSTRLDKCFSSGMFCHLTITAAVCGCLEKQFVDGDNQVGALIHVSGWIVTLFVACIGGQHFIDAGNSIAEAIWSSKWYQADTRLQKDLLFMLVRSQKELFLSVGPFGVLSFPLFVSVMKMSYSILAMLTS